MENHLEKLLEETNFTQGEYQIYRKVLRNYQLQDLQCFLDEMLEAGTVSEDQYQTAINNAELIIYKYDKWLEYDWRDTMQNAINHVLKETTNNL